MPSSSVGHETLGVYRLGFHLIFDMLGLRDYLSRSESRSCPPQRGSMGIKAVIVA